MVNCISLNLYLRSVFIFLIIDENSFPSQAENDSQKRNIFAK